MRVIIGPYHNWVGPYQIAKFLTKNDDYQDKIVHVLDWVGISQVLEWLDQKKKRKIKIEIDDYDVWNADHTMSLVIYQVLQKYKEHITGSPKVDDSDVPEELKSTFIPSAESGEDINYHRRWNWVVDEVLWTFGELKETETGLDDLYLHCDLDSNRKLIDEYEQRMTNGLRLFGKYYRGFWT